jgi:hypothetical protein
MCLLSEISPLAALTIQRFDRSMRYRLRTLLIVVSLSALVLAAWRPVERGQARQSAIRDILAEGGEIEFDGDQPATDLVNRFLRLAEWITSADFTRTVREVRFGRGVDDADLAALATLSETQRIDLSYCYRISDKGVEWVGKCPRLEELWLYRNDPDGPTNHTPPSFNFSTQGRVTDRSLEIVAQCKHLRVLCLYDNAFTNEGLTHLHSLGCLERICLNGTYVTEDGTVSLKAALPNCKVEWVESSDN